TAAAVVAAVHPAASIVAGVLGAMYGLYAAHRNGADPSAGVVLSTMLRYGVLAGAGAFVVGDLGRVLILGFPAVGLTPLPSAMATAALGQGAFQGKFSDAATSSADRLMSAFPAVAGALGLSVGVSIAAHSLILSIATGAMAATGVAAAVYAALYDPAVSPATGPARMARGYVLQALMTGLALAVTSPYLFWPFAILAAWGLGDVMWAAARAAWAAISPAPKR
ncbi:MAG: hypothetical protein KGL53_10155, partial [Elusimicrobia bacterium]|nr:hypothetical protein [Elusimicrobiota bacterium]